MCCENSEFVSAVVFTIVIVVVVASLIYWWIHIPNHRKDNEKKPDKDRFHIYLPCIICGSPRKVYDPNVLQNAYAKLICTTCKEALKSIIENEQLKQQ